MSFWDDYLSAPPFEVMSMFPGDPTDTHIVLWRGHASTSRNCGTSIRVYVEWQTADGDTASASSREAVRWWAFDPRYESGRDPALLDMHEVTCMVCATS